MRCFVLSSLSSAAAAVQQLPVPAGLGADVALSEQVEALAATIASLETELAVRMAALERAAPPPTDVRGQAARAGIPARQAGRLRLLGTFAARHPDLQTSWLTGEISTEQMDIVRRGADRLHTPSLREELVGAVLPLLPPLDPASTRRLITYTIDQLQPGDPDQQELSDHAARQLSWSKVPGGGLTFQGYLPAAEAAAFTAAIDALTASLRVAGDGLTGGQRRADALAALVDLAGTDLPTAGGLPAAMTLTVSLAEAARVALRDPAEHGTHYRARPHGGSTVGSAPAGDATVRFGVCCAAVTPVLHEQPEAGSLAGRIARTTTHPLAVGRSVRLATRAQRQALRLRDGGCAIPGCTIPAAHTEPHHVTPWAVGGATDVSNMVSLCWVHHRLTELGRFRFVRRRPGESQPRAALAHQLWWIVPSTA